MFESEQIHPKCYSIEYHKRGIFAQIRVHTIVKFDTNFDESIQISLQI